MDNDIDIRHLLSGIIYTNEQRNKYAERFEDFCNRSPIASDEVRELIAQHLPLFALIYALGLHAHDDEIMAIRKIANGLPL